MLSQRYGGGMSFLLDEIDYSDFLPFVQEVMEEVQEERLWDTYIQTQSFYEKNYTDFKEEALNKAKYSAMTPEQMEAESKRVEEQIDNFFKKGGS